MPTVKNGRPRRIARASLALLAGGLASGGIPVITGAMTAEAAAATAEHSDLPAQLQTLIAAQQTTVAAITTETGGKIVRYKVRWGDTLWGLARRFEGDGRKYPDIAALNNIADPDRIYAGTEILVDPPAGLAPADAAPVVAPPLVIPTPTPPPKVRPLRAVPLPVPVAQVHVTTRSEPPETPAAPVKPIPAATPAAVHHPVPQTPLAPVLRSVAVTPPKPMGAWPGAAAAGMPAIFDCIVAHESGGNPTALNARSGAAGLFQFMPGTWQSVGGTGSARFATVDEQTMRAKALYAREGTRPWRGDGCVA